MQKPWHPQIFAPQLQRKIKDNTYPKLKICRWFRTRICQCFSLKTKKSKLFCKFDDSVYDILGACDPCISRLLRCSRTLLVTLSTLTPQKNDWNTYEFIREKINEIRKTVHVENPVITSHYIMKLWAKNEKLFSFSTLWVLLVYTVKPFRYTATTTVHGSLGMCNGSYSLSDKRYGFCSQHCSAGWHPKNLDSLLLFITEISKSPHRSIFAYFIIAVYRI